MSHVNAPLSETGRLRLARCIVDRSGRCAARLTGSMFRSRLRNGGLVGTGRTARLGWWTARVGHGAARATGPAHRAPDHGPTGLAPVGPARIGYRLGLNPSTVHKVLRRYHALPLSWTDPATGCRLRAKPKARRYEHEKPGDLVHVDVKKSGASPTVGAPGPRTGQGQPDQEEDQAGTAFIHNAVDDHSRLAYCEILNDEKKETACAFWERANAWFNSCGISVKRVLTDNRSAYRSHLFAETLGPITHKRTRPYRPQTNGKVERFNRTLEQEWAYAQPYTSETQRVAAFPAFLHTYNHHRGHTALAGKSPADRVPNLCGQNT